MRVGNVILLKKICNSTEKNVQDSECQTRNNMIKPPAKMCNKKNTTKQKFL